MKAVGILGLALLLAFGASNIGKVETYQVAADEDMPVCMGD